MYNNIGNKIKILAQIICVLGVVASVILGLVICFTTDEFNVIGLLYILIGSILSWISTLTMYGFGELIEKVCVIEKKVVISKSNIFIKTENSSTENLINTTSQKEKETKETKGTGFVKHKWRCSNCNNMISEETCPYCGQQY